jgi:hypothetical protein
VWSIALLGSLNPKEQAAGTHLIESMWEVKGDLKVVTKRKILKLTEIEPRPPIR